jgi:hypothetical protein
MRKRYLALVPIGAAAVFAVAGAASNSSEPSFSDVATANTKSVGYAPAHKLSQELAQIAVAQGSVKLENPTTLTTYYGYQSDVVNDQAEPVMIPVAPFTTEAQKTEPDKNTYLVFKHGLPGGSPSYDYGSSFLFQGHEIAVKVDGIQQGYITRINLDADAAHRVTLVATQDSSGKAIPVIDGSTWNPFAQRLLFTNEGNSTTTGGVWQADLGVPAKVDDLLGSMGRGGYEGIQNDSAGNLWIVEDIGGVNKLDASGASVPAKRPNSFVYRFVPDNTNDLTKGKLQALRVYAQDGHAITFETEAALNNPDQVALHTYGNSFKTEWVTVHDTAVDGTAPFNANAAAKAAHATPLKRPENGVFRPGTGFREFYFDETGDTNATSPENSTAGGWGAALKLTQSSPTASTGTLTMFYKSDQQHSGFDNVQFLSRNKVSYVEDAGDLLHQQRNALDSGYIFDATVDYSNASNQPVRWLAEGRDPSATIDSANGGFGKNDGDNEITGIHVSDGDPSVHGILGAKVPQLWHNGWRWFWSEQHGDNVAWEVVPASHAVVGSNDDNESNGDNGNGNH